MLKVEFDCASDKNLNKLVKKFEWDELISYKGQPAVRIINPNKNMWDVIIIKD